MTDPSRAGLIIELLELEEKFRLIEETRIFGDMWIARIELGEARRDLDKSHTAFLSVARRRLIYVAEAIRKNRG